MGRRHGLNLLPLCLTHINAIVGLPDPPDWCCFQGPLGGGEAAGGQGRPAAGQEQRESAPSVSLPSSADQLLSLFWPTPGLFAPPSRFLNPKP